MISEEKFINDATEFQRLSVSYLPDECWRLKCAPGRDLYLECDGRFVGEDDFSARLVTNVCYSKVYHVPVLWFNFYDIDGTLLRLEQFERFIRRRVERSSNVDANILNGISQNEHPILGIAFYNLHPCRTAELLELLSQTNVVMSFLSIFGSMIGMTSFPPEMISATACQNVSGACC